MAERISPGEKPENKEQNEKSWSVWPENPNEVKELSRYIRDSIELANKEGKRVRVDVRVEK